MATVFVGNLSPEITDSDLRAIFQEYGKIASLRLIARRGSAYVELSPEAANAAVEALRGTELKGRTVDVTLERASAGRFGKPRGRGRSRRR